MPTATTEHSVLIALRELTSLEQQRLDAEADRERARIAAPARIRRMNRSFHSDCCRSGPKKSLARPIATRTSPRRARDLRRRYLLTRTSTASTSTDITPAFRRAGSQVATSAWCELGEG